VEIRRSLKLVKQADGSALYAEAAPAETAETGISLSIWDSSLPEPAPPSIEIALNFQLSPSLAPPPGPPARTPLRPELPKEGEEVVVIKSAIDSVLSPPEWLEQYLGKTGRVVWVTETGAEVELDTGVTWFPNTELRVLR
jgi:hypothetical protein